MKKLVSTCLIVAGLLIPGSMVHAEPPFERHPEIRRAIHSLEMAKNDLKHADHDFRGHREAALQACDNAIYQLRLALGADQH